MRHFGISNNFKDEKKYDVNILIESECFPANKSVLKRSSRYFHAMFDGDRFQESTMCDIFIHDIDQDAFHQFINFTYTGKNHCGFIYMRLTVCIASNWHTLIQLLRKNNRNSKSGSL